MVTFLINSSILGYVKAQRTFMFILIGDELSTDQSKG